MNPNTVTDELDDAATQIWAIWEKFTLQSSDETLGEAVRLRDPILRTAFMDSLNIAYNMARALTVKG